jgi:CBS domain-containing protein
LLVHDVMSISPVTVSPATLVSDLLTRFDRHDFNVFPVVCTRRTAPSLRHGPML